MGTSLPEPPPLSPLTPNSRLSVIHPPSSKPQPPIRPRRFLHVVGTLCCAVLWCGAFTGKFRSCHVLFSVWLFMHGHQEKLDHWRKLDGPGFRWLECPARPIRTENVLLRSHHALRCYSRMAWHHPHLFQWVVSETVM